MDIVEALEAAIDAEVKAQQKYSELSQLAEDTETRALLEQLIHWEASHEKMLRDRVATLRFIKS